MRKMLNQDTWLTVENTGTAMLTRCVVQLASITSKNGISRKYNLLFTVWHGALATLGG